MLQQPRWSAKGHAHLQQPCAAFQGTCLLIVVVQGRVADEGCGLLPAARRGTSIPPSHTSISASSVQKKKSAHRCNRLYPPRRRRHHEPANPNQEYAVRLWERACSQFWFCQGTPHAMHAEGAHAAMRAGRPPSGRSNSGCQSQPHGMQPSSTRPTCLLAALTLG